MSKQEGVPNRRRTLGADLNVTDVTKRFTSGDRSITAVDKVSLNVPSGGTLAIVGASGSGKSTLLHLIGGVERADEGSVHLGEVEVTALSRTGLDQYRRRVGLIFQRFHLLPAMSALDNVIMPLLAARNTRDKVERARAALQAVGLGDREQALPSELSGGQQQRVAIARAIVGNPAILLADEPTGNLDSVNGREIMELLIGLRDRLGATIVIVTHDQAVAEYCDRLIRLKDGSVVETVVLGADKAAR